MGEPEDCLERRVAAPSLAPAIDRPHLKQMTLGDQRLETEVLRLFDTHSRMVFSHMAAESPNGLALLAHGLVGAARGIGAWNVAEAAEAVERAAASCGQGPMPPGEIAAALEALAGALRDAHRAIDELLAPS